MSFNRTVTERAIARVLAAGALEVELTLSAEEAAQLATWLRQEPYRNRCRRRHLADVRLPIGNPYE